MLRGTAARRYAEGVFAIARDQNSFDRWLGDLATIRETFINADMARFLADPKPSVSEKEAVAEKLLAAKVDRLALNMALLLIRREHAEAAAALERDFQEMVNEHRNVAVAEVTMAIDMTMETMIGISNLNSISKPSRFSGTAFRLFVFKLIC